MTNDLLARLTAYARHFQGLSKAGCVVYDFGKKRFYGDMFCHRCRHCNFESTHNDSCIEAQRWGGRYIYFCPVGLVFVAAVLCETPNRIDAGMLSGPIMIGQPEDYAEAFPISLDTVTRIEPHVVNDMAEVLSAGLSGEFSSQQYSEMLNDIYETKDAKERYPVEIETELCVAIEEGDTFRAREQLNLLLGHIFFGANGNLETIKARVSELLVVISRSAIKGGADASQIFLMNKNYFEEIKRFDSIEKLSIWLSSVLSRLMRYVFELGSVKHSDVISKIITFIHRNYMRRITLDDIANHVYLSRSYVSKLFKEEMGCPLMSYINRVRVQKSKALLARDMSLTVVAYNVGFEDQSYYTKVFKRLTGYSPGQYKMKKGKM